LFIPSRSFSLASGARLSKSKIRSVQLLGLNAPLRWSQDAAGLTVALPAQRPGDYAFAFKISPVEAAAQR
jgi:alpha-L-fucosidase